MRESDFQHVAARNLQERTSYGIRFISFEYDGATSQRGRHHSLFSPPINHEPPPTKIRPCERQGRTCFEYLIATHDICCPTTWFDFQLSCTSPQRDRPPLRIRNANSFGTCQFAFDFLDFDHFVFF